MIKIEIDTWIVAIFDMTPTLLMDMLMLSNEDIRIFQTQIITKLMHIR